MFVCREIVFSSPAAVLCTIIVEVIEVKKKYTTEPESLSYRTSSGSRLPAKAVLKKVFTNYFGYIAVVVVLVVVRKSEMRTRHEIVIIMRNIVIYRPRIATNRILLAH